MPRPEEADLRGWRFETFEERLALSAQPVADFWFADCDQPIVEPSSSVLLPMGAEGHGWTDVAAARDQFGLHGDRQTVAIIDSGIAYDHVALGGGLGNGYRVVGGWDFAENDADPYDDGPAGFHGTHVAGIVGARDARYAGVATNVDLVGLRVFDDQGNGYFSWVEQALAWVHQHRNDFANPITTVNLSLGTEWNSNSLPSWATLEKGLKQLADDGIFIAVAAGNSYLTYNSPGLSYPAVSQYVTPVASVDASGNLSRFSQRSDRVIAAPGERIMSTLPDHFYGGDGIKNDWGAASGTSMATPYVAGASILIREAMQDLGFTQITQGTISDLFRRTADNVFDAATNASYRRLNLQRALDALVGPDEFGGATTSATAVGHLTTALQISGTIGRTSDQDFFQFTADRTGKVTLALTGAQQLGAKWQPLAGGQIDGNKLTLNVVAGQSYAVGVAGGGSAIGKYTVDMQLQAAAPVISAINWGTVEQTRIDHVATTGDSWYQITAGRTGRMTVESFFSVARGNVDFEVYDAQQRLIANGGGSGGSQRIDFDATAGDKLFIHVRGTSGDVSFRLTNLLSITGNTAFVYGTEGADSFRWQAGQQQQIIINGVNYTLAGNSQVTFDSRGGIDAITLVGGSVAETATLRPGSAQLFGPGYSVSASNVERTQVIGGASDQAFFYDSTGNDTFEASPSWARMTGASYQNLTQGFGSVVAVAQSGGYDVATLRDSAGADQLDANPASAWLRGSGYGIRADGFDDVTVLATAGGSDIARLLGTQGRDILTVWGGMRNLTAGGVQISTQGFQRVEFNGGSGSDTVDFYTAGTTSRLSGRSNSGLLTDSVFATQFNEIESLLANVRAMQDFQTDLVTIDFLFRRIGRA
jgi:subtilisin family serine protease